jgi:uncharacterized protein (DUF1778 family)
MSKVLFGVRLTLAQRQAIWLAAATKGQKVSEFAREALLKAAREAMDEPRS